MSDYTKWHVLIVEDSEDNADVMWQLFEHHNIKTTFVEDGEQAVNYLTAYEPPTLIVMDLHMPQMDGWETLVAIRSNPALAHIPVVAVTAYHSPEVAAEALNAGFDAYFSKPVAAASFINELADVIG